MINVSSMEQERRQPIMGILLDPPNAITFVGALLAMSACAMAVMGKYNLALICVLWSHLADSLDGLVARRMQHRQPGMNDVGKAMDALGDFLSAGVFPLIFLASLGEAAPFPTFAGLLICAAGILRLSYFEAFGLSGGSFCRGAAAPQHPRIRPIVLPRLPNRNGSPDPADGRRCGHHERVTSLVDPISKDECDLDCPFGSLHYRDERSSRSSVNKCLRIGLYSCNSLLQNSFDAFTSS
ncbi:CDP-alcohol phosphatidyltransferase family protein (plasmid) [Rhizobium leguminosarum]|nr:CDP-alcohol phosphatidyltransferase family protein [Rhizobium leguminosarum]